MKSNIDDLVFVPKYNPGSTIRMFCFPYAGGSSTTYVKWVNDLHPNIELACIELPGRGKRFSDPCYENINEMVSDIAEIILKKFSDKKIVFYGHSMGAKVAYFVADKLSRNNIILHHIFISSSAYPGEIVYENIHYLSDDQFVGAIKSRYGFPDEILNHPELLQLILPKLRADFKVIENMAAEIKNIIPCNATLLAGNKDIVKLDHMYKWKTVLSGKVSGVVVNGDHFFVDDMYKEVLVHVNEL